MLGEAWQIADTENRGLLTKPGFCMVLRLIGWYQNGQQQPTTELAFKPAPIPRFDGVVIPAPPVATGGAAAGASPVQGALQPQLSGQGTGSAPIRVPPLDAAKAQQYSGLFGRLGAQNGILDGAAAKSIFERAGLPNETLGKIWMLSDREQRGALDETDFIVAMHLLTCMKARSMSALPNTLPQGLYEAAARRGQRPPSRQATTATASAIPRQLTGGGASSIPRVHSPLARPPSTSFAETPMQSAQPTGTPQWLITPSDKAQYDRHFNSIDTAGRGVLSGEQAVQFFSDSRLSEEVLASIWDLADINSEGQLNRDEFAVAMFLIRQQRAPNPMPLPAFLPAALVPPSMRGSGQAQAGQSGFNQQQQQQSAFAPAVQTPTQSKASDDLFGLDDTPSSMSQPALQPQGTGASTTRDPFASGSSQQGSPSSPAQFQPQQTGSGSNSFKPFVPTSAFGASLAAQNTGGSSDGFRQSQSQSQQTPSTPRGPAAPMPSALDDLLGEPDANPEQSRQIPNDSSELANMNSQITTLRSQMETSQASRATTQTDLTGSTTQKRELEGRLKEFRTQYESEVRAVKELEQQLTTSRAGTRKLEQDLAMLEGTRQDLQSQHKNLSAQLQADQSANADLKAKSTAMNGEIEGLRGEVEKLTNEARQLKGLVSISRKQLASNESERSRLEGDKEGLTREVADLQQEHTQVQAQTQTQTQSRSLPSASSPGPVVASPVASPSAGSTSMNPFFKSTPASPEPTPAAPAAATGPTPSAFDAIFGPSTVFAPTGQASSRSGTPPATSFIGRSLPEVGSGAGSSSGDANGSGIDTAAAAAAAGVAAVSAAAVGAVAVAASGSDSGEDSASESSSASEAGVATPPATATDAQLPAANSIPPLQSESRQITPTQLPLGGGALDASATAEGSDAGSSVVVVPPASRVGGDMTPRDLASLGPESAAALAQLSGDVGEDGEREVVPGAFPAEDRGLETTTQEVGSSVEIPAPAPTNVADDFDSAFASFGQGESSRDVGGSDDPFAPRSEQQTQSSSAEFPPIRSLERDDESESDSDEEDAAGGFEDDFTTASPPRDGVASPSITAAGAGDAGLGSVAVEGADAATAGDAPDISREVSPPSYAQTGEAQRSASNSFPPEFGSLLPARKDPTSPPAIAEDRGMTAPASTNADSNPFDAFSQTQQFDANASDTFVDASSRPLSSVPDFQQTTTTAAPVAGQRNVFDEFDDFGDLSEAREADPSAQDDFATVFGGSGQGQSDFAGFDDAFGSSSTADTPSKTPVAPEPTREIQSSNGFAAFTPSASTSGPSAASYSPFSGISAPSATTASGVQRTPQEVQHDWDAIFSDLDSSKPLDTSFGNSTATSTATPAANAKATTPTPAAPQQQEEEIWLPPPGPPPGRTAITTNGASSSGGLAAPTAKGAGGRPPIGRAITPGTEHDDPILKRLVGMGYPRADALGALERFDYDINKVSLLPLSSEVVVVRLIVRAND